MARIKKKGTAGSAKNYITRTQAVRKLQVSLPDFRRLCIFKGIYPREPRSKKKVSKSSTPSTTFYYTKDIQYLLHEPLLAKLRVHKALSKKIARSLGRGEVGDAARHEKSGAPKLTLDHIIKERYPTFVDALRDLDDALSLLFLFANLPSTSTVPAKTISLCQRLCLEFEHYLIATHTLRKSFLSIKGIYYQATIQGQDILWLVPYKFVQRVTGDVDFRIMGTFVEFYTTLLGFVNYRLYTSIGLVYPPKFNAKSDEQGGELSAFMLEGEGIGSNGQTNTVTNEELQVQGKSGHALSEQIQKQIEGIKEDSSVQNATEDGQSLGLEPDEERENAIDTFLPTDPDADILPQPQTSATEAASLFAPFTFFLSRETPRQPLEFILRAFGCKRVGWDAVLGDGAFTHNELDPSITHQVVDRPPLAGLPEAQVSNTMSTSQVMRQGTRMPGRTYIQPQWVWDCINEVKLLRPDLYAPGATLPPHLSPWVKPTKGAYDPTAPLAEQEREGEAEEAELSDDNAAQALSEGEKTERPTFTEDADSGLADTNGMDVADGASESSSGSDVDSQQTFNGFDEGGPAGSGDEAKNVPDDHQRELEAEAAGLSYKANGTQVKGILKTNGSATRGDDMRKRAARRRTEEEEELERRKMMLGRKKRKLVDKMLYSNKKKDAEAESLRKKRRKIENRRV
ncbi:MAG: hypothetical protein Q9163_003891 [Psora crenata]